jgi:CelD/BcsL family acetyltransferase involved in cellulose biosynthesis
MGGTLYLYFSGYQREFGKYSVMTTLLAEIIKHAFAEGIGTVNLSTGNDVSKTRWAPREWLECDGVTVSSRLTGRFSYATYRFLETTMSSQDLRKQVMHVLSRDRWPAANAKASGERTIAQAVAFVLGGGVI